MKSACKYNSLDILLISVKFLTEENFNRLLMYIQ